MRPPAALIIRLRGPASWHPEPGFPGFTLTGISGEPAEEVTIGFPVPAPPDLPHKLADVSIERASDGIRITGCGRRWQLATTTCFVHREIAASFYRAIAPQPARWSRRLFWRVVLLLAANPLGRRLLRMLQR